jgi:hypothetical protein
MVFGFMVVFEVTFMFMFAQVSFSFVALDSEFGVPVGP